MKNIIVAYDQERAIGANNDLLWKKNEMRADMKHFRELTAESVLIMGRKTLESIGIALPGRDTIVVTRGDNVSIPDIQIAHSLEEAYRLAEEVGKEEVFVCGGGQIYEQALKDVQRIYATEVHAKIDGADTYFPELDDYSWSPTSIIGGFRPDKDNKYPYSFVTFERRRW